MIQEAHHLAALLDGPLARLRLEPDGQPLERRRDEGFGQTRGDLVALPCERAGRVFGVNGTKTFGGSLSLAGLRFLFARFANVCGGGGEPLAHPRLVTPCGRGVHFVRALWVGHHFGQLAKIVQFGLW